MTVHINTDQMARYLITTADERTWKFDRPVIFLGEWCRLYDRKHIWQGMDAVVARPYGLSQARKDMDYSKARALEAKLFPILCNVLNQHHGTQHDARFWRIVLGHWFRRYVDVIINRVSTLEQCLQEEGLSGTTVYSDEHYMLAPMDSYAAIWAFNDDRWNNALDARLLKLLDVSDCHVEVIDGDKTEGFRWIVATTQRTLKQSVTKWILQQPEKMAGVLVSDSDAFIINSYLPRKEKLLLELAFRQVPQLWSAQRTEITASPDRALRHDLAVQISGKECASLFEIACRLVLELLPVCYLEGFSQLSEKVDQLPWPSRPKFIFTSNNFDTDEYFKLWTAQKTESGAKYVAGQHGNNYGTYRYSNPTIEEETADKFLTWGWADGLSQHSPAFIFKTTGCNAKGYNPDGGLLLIENMLSQRLHTWDSAYEFEVYFADQIAFIENLKKSPRQELIVRIHPAYVYLRSFEVARLNDFDSGLKINTGAGSVIKLIRQSRLVVHGYDSTGLLETLSRNIPTLAFWQNNFDHLRDSARPYYQLLVDAGIVHLTSESAASKVNEIWEDVESWWSGSAVQEARIAFCDRYAKLSQKPVSDLYKLLSSDLQ